MNERDSLMEKRKMRRLNSLAELILGNAADKSAANTQEIIGLGAKAAAETEEGSRKAIGNIKRAGQRSQQLTEQLLPDDDPRKAELDMATWLASIRAGLDPIDLPEMEGAPSLDYFQGQDIDSTEDATQAQVDTLIGSLGAGYDRASDIPAAEGSGVYDYSGLPDYMQPGSAFRSALNAVEADSYDTMFGEAHKVDSPFKGTKITQMTMDEIFDLVESGGDFHTYNRTTYNEDTTAIGKYQMVGKTLRDLRDRGILKKLGINSDTKFTQDTQDSIAMHLAERRVRPKFSMAEAREELKNEWEGFENLSDGELNLIINEIRGS